MGNEIVESKKQEVETNASNDQSTAKGRLLEDYLNSSAFKSQNDINDKVQNPADSDKKPSESKDANTIEKNDNGLKNDNVLPELLLTDEKQNSQESKKKESEEISSSEDQTQQVEQKGEGDNKSKDDDDSKQKDGELESNKPGTGPYDKTTGKDAEGKDKELEDEAGKSSESDDPTNQSDESDAAAQRTDESNSSRAGESEDRDAERPELDKPEPPTAGEKKGSNITDPAKVQNYLPTIELLA